MNVNIINFLPIENDIASTRILHELIDCHTSTSNRNSSLISRLNHETDSLETRTEEINQILLRNYDNGMLKIIINK